MKKLKILMGICSVAIILLLVKLDDPDATHPNLEIQPVAQVQQ